MAYVYYRSYGTPPSMVMHVMSSVCVLLQQSTDWDTVKHLMADPIAFLRTLTNFNKDNVPDKVITIVACKSFSTVYKLVLSSLERADIAYDCGI